MRGSLTIPSLLALASGCIPSHRMVHEGNRYFEHCYGADFDRRVTRDQNEACWQAWLAQYSRDQPAHRVDYALRRMEALQAGEAALQLPGLGNASPTELSDAQETLRDSARSGQVPALSADAADASSEAIPNGCSDACTAYEARCLGTCPDRNVDCQHGCSRERAICLGGCH